MMTDPDFSVLDDSEDSDNEHDSEMNNTVLRAKRGLATGSVNAPFQDMLQLIQFIPSVKKKQMALAGAYTDIDFKEQANRESRLKNITVNEKNVSFKTQNQGTPGSSGSGRIGTDERRRNSNYRRAKEVFPQIGEAKPEVRRFIGGISKPNRQSLKLQKNSSKLKACPCPESSTCTFAFTCEAFKRLTLSQKISFVKN